MSVNETDAPPALISASHALGDESMMEPSFTKFCRSASTGQFCVFRLFVDVCNVALKIPAFGLTTL